jgi:hypothetical protein
MMATAVFEPRESRLERYFFPGMALLILGTVFLGFARSYYLAGVFRAPLPNWLIHVHGAAFSSWILLLIAQTSLVAANRVDVHRKVGLVGFGLACLMVILGTLAATDSLRRALGPGGPAAGTDPKAFYIIPLTDMLIFGTLVFFAFRARFHPPAHKRLMLIATIALMDAAITRWPIGFIRHNPFWVTVLFTYGFLVLLLAFDLWTTRKVHRVTIWASLFLIAVQQVRVPIGGTSGWHAFASWAQNLARVIHG